MNEQCKEIGLAITEDSCVHVAPKDNGVYLRWRKGKNDSDVTVETIVGLSNKAAIATAKAILSFYGDEPEESA